MFCGFVCFIATFQVAFRVFIHHVNEVVVVSEESMRWLPDGKAAQVSSGDACKDRDGEC